MALYTVFHGMQYGDQAKELRSNGKQAVVIADKQHSQNKRPGSLGYGFYTFLDDGHLAKHFALKFGKDVIVFQLLVDLSLAHTLAFDINPLDRQQFYSWLQQPRTSKQVQRLQARYQNTGKQKSLDGALIEAYCKMLRDLEIKNVLAVRSATHTEVGVSVPGSAVPNGVEVLIKDRSIIVSDYFQVFHDESTQAT